MYFWQASACVYGVYLPMHIFLWQTAPNGPGNIHFSLILLWAMPGP
jgi:hypothetical protein